jgi:hypothetical protein
LSRYNDKGKKGLITHIVFMQSAGLKEQIDGGTLHVSGSAPISTAWSDQLYLKYSLVGIYISPRIVPPLSDFFPKSLESVDAISRVVVNVRERRDYLLTSPTNSHSIITLTFPFTHLLSHFIPNNKEARFSLATGS